MLAPDMDVILAIHHAKRLIEVETTINCQHIYGHQDTRHTKQTEEEHDLLSDTSETESLDSHSPSFSQRDLGKQTPQLDP